MPDDKTYTAEQLAAAINGELGTKIKARTVYFYRSRDVLSPLQMVESQPRFSERHRLELKAFWPCRGPLTGRVLRISEPNSERWMKPSLSRLLALSRQRPGTLSSRPR